MADVISELLVRINAEDNASAVLGKVSDNITGMSSAGVAGTKSLEQFTGAMKVSKTSAEAYRKKMSEASEAVTAKKKALDSAKTAYDSTTKATQRNTAQLSVQKAKTEALIQSKKREIAALEQSSSAINDGSKAYKDNQKAIQWTKAELGTLETQHKSIVRSMGEQETSLAKSAAAYKAAKTEVKAAQETYSGYSAGLAKVEQAEKAAARAASIQKFESAGKSIKDFGEGVDRVTKPLQIAAVGAVGAGVAVTKAAMEYETAFTGVKKTVEGTPEQLERVNTEIQDMSKRIPVQATELANLAATAGQLGVDADHIAKFTEITAAMGVATNLAGEEGAATLAQFINVSGDSLDNVDRVGSAIVALGNNTATTEADIAHMALRMGKFGNTVHMTSDEVLGYSAALASSGIEAQLGGSAMGRTWLDIQSAVSGNTETLQKYAKYAGTTAEEFKKQWSTDPSGAFNGLIKGLSTTEDLTAAMMDLGIENTQDQQAVIALAKNYDLLEKCMNLSSSAYKENTALSKEANTAYATTANKIQLAKNAVNGAARSWGNVLLPEVAKGAGAIGNLADKIANADEGTKKAVISGAKAVVITGAAVKGTTSLIKGIGGTVEGIASIKKGIDKVGGIAPKIQLIGGAIKGIAAVTPALLPIAGALAVPAATVLGMKLYAEHAEKTRQELLHSGDGAVQLANQTKKAVSAADELSKKIQRLKELNTIINENSGSDNAESQEKANAALKEKKELIQWFNDNYGQYLSNLEKENGITESKAQTLIEMTKAQKENKLAEMNNKMTEAGDNVPNLQNGIRVMENNNEALYEQSTALNNLQAGLRSYKSEALEVIKAEKNGLISREEESKQLDDLQQKYGYLTQAYREAYGSEVANPFLDMGVGLKDADKVIQDIGNLITKNDELIKKNDTDILTARKSIEEYQKAARIANDILISELPNAIQQGDSKVQEYITKIGTYGKSVGFTMNEMGGYAQQAALKLNGFSTVEQAVADKNNGMANSARDCVNIMLKWGATAQEAAIQGSLLKNGFNSLAEAASAGKIDIVSQQANELAHSMKLIPDNKTISISADGDVSLIDNAQQKIEAIKTDGDVNVSVNADGDVSIVDETTGKIQTLSGLGDVHISLNSDGDIEILDDAEQKLATIDGETGEITVNGDYEGADEIEKAIEDKNNIDNKNVNLKATGSYPGMEDISIALTHQNSLKDVDVTYTVTYKTFGTPPKQQAKGTQNFGGGLAMVNDQTGISDPRELIIDRGRAFIPQGRNVILPLSRGAKVYTAAQTKRIMANMGIPQYAEGKDNSDAFKTAKDDWTHYTRTHAVSVTEEMKKWVALSKEFTSNQKDVEDIQEGIWAATRKVRDEQNELSEEYLATRAVFNDWDEYSDSMVAGFQRVSDREKQYVKDSVITEKEANTYLKKLGKDMFDDRVENSKAWLERQVKYNNMSAESYIESVEKMKAAAYEAYGAGMITSPQLNISLQEYDDMIADKTKEANTDEYAAWKKEYEEWITNNETFGWQNGDSLVQTWERVIAGIRERFNQGKIDWDTYINDSNAAKRNLYNAQTDAYDEMLEAQRAYIDEVDDGYNKLIDKKEEAFDMRILTRNISEASEKAKIYAGAVTQRGKDVYKETTENLEDLLHQKTVKELQAKQTEVVEKMRADLDTAEKYKKQVLNSLSNAQIDIAGIARSIQGDTANMQGLFNDLLKGIENLQNNRAATYGTTYNMYGVGDGIMAWFMPKAKQSLTGG